MVWLGAFALIATTAFVLLMVVLDAQIRDQFDNKKWNIPAKVFARPLTLYSGKVLSPQQLLAELRWADYRQVYGAPQPGTFFRQGDTWRIHRRAFPFWDGAEPSREITLTLEQGQISALSQQQKPLAMVRLEPQYVGGIFPAHNEDRDLIELKDVPAELVAALIITEDKRFFQHSGISFRGIARAMFANAKAGRFVQGGSTLTQQLVKNFFLNQDRTLLRKIQEALMSLLLELHYDKEAILQAYLNEVYLGQSGRRGIHGFGLAARFYFGKHITQLDLAESVTLVGLVKGASFYNPKRHPKRAKKRRDLILTMMADERVISQDDALVAKRQPLRTASPQRAGQREYPAFLELARLQLQRDYSLADLQNNGLRIFTTLDPWVQHSAERSSSEHLAALEKHPKLPKDALETAVVVTSIEGGEIRALVGSKRPEFFGFNRALNAHRPIGSLAKPVVFLSALKSKLFHWGSLVDDGAVQVASKDGDVWQPKNYDLTSHGVVPMLDALVYSYNQATARVGMNVGLKSVVDTFRLLGYTGDLPAYPSLLLGATPMSPLEVAGWYQTLASGGFVTPLRTIEAVTTAEGNTLSSYALDGDVGVRKDMAEWLRYGLEEVVKRGTAKRLSQRFTEPLAGKTGTSDAQRDAWFAGFDGQHLGVVWVGRDDNQSFPFTGSSAALPVWEKTFARIGVTPLPKATTLVDVRIDEEGNIADSGCGRGRRYPFIKTELPSSITPCDDRQKPSRIKRLLDWIW